MNARSHRPQPRHQLLLSLVTPLALSLTLGACGQGATAGSDPSGRVKGQTSFVSAPLAGRAGGARGTATDGAAGGDAGAAAPGAAAAPPAATPARKVEETDLYRVDGNRLYYLNAYRGLMVFDVTDVDHPKLLGRSPITGTPVEMLVRSGVAQIVVADWYGTLADGSPFHGSIVRSIDATDPTNMKVLGEAKLGGWVQDVRVVGDVLYAVSQDYGWSYGWDVPVADGVGGGVAVYGGSSTSSVIVSSVAFGGGTVKQMGEKRFDGSGGVFYVNSDSIMLAHDVMQTVTTSDGYSYEQPTGQTDLQYVDISDPAGSIRLRGDLIVDGRVQGWGADNGRWNLDFADDHYAHAFGCSGTYCGATGSNYVLATVDFGNPDAPVLASSLSIPGSSWLPTARFDNGRAYISPSDGYWYGGAGGTATVPVQIYDTSDPKNPALAGQTTINGNVWLFMPNGNRLFALGNEPADSSSGPYAYSSVVSLRYLDVTDAKNPTVIGTAKFGDGWAWTPAADTFKAFIKDDTKGLVVLPFSGWSAKDGQYNNGVQLISYSPSSIRAAGAAHGKGWVERGIFVGNRIVSLSDTALSVVDYTNPDAPAVTATLTLARNVVDARPSGATIAELSSDWYDNDKSSTEMRVLPLSDAEENVGNALATATLDGVDAQVFRNTVNADLAYVLTSVQRPASCGTPGAYDPTGSGKGCVSWGQELQVVDTSGGGAKVRGKLDVPVYDGYFGYDGWGWGGFYWYDWFDGADVVQVGADALALRRWVPSYTRAADGSWVYDDARQSLYVIDLHDPDHPSIASTTITRDPSAWWGNMRSVGNTLYVTHQEWLDDPSGTSPRTRYWLDSIDLTDRAHPTIGRSINVPGVMVGASSSDPTVLYTVDYQWDGAGHTLNNFSAIKLDGGLAYLLSTLSFDGYFGNVFVQGNTAYATTQRYDWSPVTGDDSRYQLHAIDLTNPSAPVDNASRSKLGWGWLLGVAGDRAVMTSGWGANGVDIYKLAPGAAPSFDKSVRTRGWAANSLTRQDNTLYLSSGYWGVQAISL
jgi:hypothetical protein